MGTRRSQKSRSSVAVRGKIESHSVQRPSSLLDPRWLCFLAIVIAAAVYYRTAGFPFVYDDHGQIVSKLRVQSWHNLPKYFTQHLWSQMGEELPNNYYRPLFLVWFLLNHTLFGLQPAGWHISAVLVHVAVTWVVYLFAVRELKDRWSAGIAALIFAVHPTHVEDVAWISGIDEPLFALFALLTIYFYLRWREGGGALALSASLISFVTSLLFKETAVILPALVLFYEWRRTAPLASEVTSPGDAPQKFTSRLWRAGLFTLPFVALDVVYLAVRMRALRGLAPNIGNHATTLSVALSYPSAIFFYLHKLLWPSSLSVFYSFEFVTHPGWRNFVLPLVVILATGAGLYWLSRHAIGIGPACAWLLIPMLPPLLALARFDVRDLVHDRYLYLPTFGFAMIVAALIRQIKIPAWRVARIPAIQLVVVAVCVGALSVATVQQSSTWESDQVLYQRGVDISPNNPLALDQLGRLYSQQHDYEHAREYFRRALAADPDDYRTLMSYGVTMAYLDDYDAAIPPLLHATQLHPTAGMPYFFLGLSQYGKKMLPEAEASFRKSIELVPGKSRQHFALGQIYEDEGRLGDARKEYIAEIRIDPKSQDAQERLREIDARMMRGGGAEKP